MLISYRLPQVEEEFQQLLVTEATWPAPLPSPKNLYARFFDLMGQVFHNIVCTSCGCIDHRQVPHKIVLILYPPSPFPTVRGGVNFKKNLNPPPPPPKIFPSPCLVPPPTPAAPPQFFHLQLPLSLANF